MEDGTSSQNARGGPSYRQLVQKGARSIARLSICEEAASGTTRLGGRAEVPWGRVALHRQAVPDA
ncbi:MAG: hypothetical protein KAJ19_25490 [Gammaproteobacteria bacterium]|nr:hypothetical protein [Gammaproteobacteria bacterium]